MARRWGWLLFVSGAAGCTSIPIGPASVHPDKSPVARQNPAILLMDTEGPPPSPAPPRVPGSGLTLAASIQEALSLHPDLAFAAGQADAARGTLIQAGLYPNPTVGYGADDINSPGGGAGKQGLILGQTIVTGNKLGLASAAAAWGAEIADLRTRSRLFEVVARVRTAFYEALAARQEVDVAREVQQIAQSGLDTAEKLRQAGVVGQPDVLRARVELEQSRVRVAMAEQRATTARQLLATALGRTDMVSEPVLGSLTAHVPDYELNRVRQAVLENSADLQAARVAVSQAEATLARAEAEVVPDLRVEVRPFYSDPDRRAEVNVAVTAPIPVFNRNQGNILAARAGIAQAHAALRQAELSLTERLTQAFQRYQNARQQVTAYEKNILPAAQESVRLVAIAYGQGDQRYDFTALLEAQRSLAQAKLGLVQAQGELQKAVSELEGLLQKNPEEIAPSPER